MRNGPPYPLGEGDHSAAERKHMGGGSTTKKQVKSDRSESSGRSSGGSSKSSSSASKDISRSGGLRSIMDNAESIPKKELADKFQKAAEDGELTKTIVEEAKRVGKETRDKIKTEMEKEENKAKLKQWGPVAAYTASYIIQRVAPGTGLAKIATVVKIASPLVALKYSGMGTAALMVACGATADILIGSAQLNRLKKVANYASDRFDDVGGFSKIGENSSKFVEKINEKVSQGIYDKAMKFADKANQEAEQAHQDHLKWLAEQPERAYNDQREAAAKKWSDDSFARSMRAFENSKATFASENRKNQIQPVVKDVYNNATRLETIEDIDRFFLGK